MNPDWVSYTPNTVKDVMFDLQKRAKASKERRLKECLNSLSPLDTEDLQWLNNFLFSFTEKEKLAIDEKVTCDLVILGMKKISLEEMPLGWKLKMQETLRSI